jgi:dsDNA-specific endonuclease/ATPase MutS2
MPLNGCRTEIGVPVETENNENVLTMARRITELMMNLEGKRERTRQHLQNGEYSLRSDYNTTAQNSHRANSIDKIMTSTQATSLDAILLNANDREDGEISHDEEDIGTKHNSQLEKITSKQPVTTSKTPDSIESTTNKRKSTLTTGLSLRRAEGLKKRSSLTSVREPVRSQSPVRRRPTSPARLRLRHSRSRKSDSPSPVRRISPSR